MTPEEFVTRWRSTTLNERQTYQMHFADVCHLVGYDPPAGSGMDKRGNIFAFEYSLKKDAGGQGYADVFLQGHFAVEYKAPGKYKDLQAAYDQLKQYRERLFNPPLLVVTDIQNWVIYTNFQNTETRPYTFTHEDIANNSRVREYIEALFFAPEKLHPRRNTEQVTQEAAEAFRLIADNMRGWRAEPERIAHFLTKLVFCLFAEDVALLPALSDTGAGVFSTIIEQTRTDPRRFIKYAHDLFEAMNTGGDVLLQPIPYFNGALFAHTEVEELQLEALTELARAARLNWAAVEPGIFGTLFERSLDPEKRSQLGAHYTGVSDIDLVIDPVLMRPLRREWEKIQAQARPIREKYDAALTTNNRKLQTDLHNQLAALREQMLRRLREVRVLDPACGSGNFLYVALQRLMNLEKEVLYHDLFLGMTRPMPEVHPRQLYGMELNPIAHALASIVVWIGYIQWRQNNGYGRAFGEPILQDLSENIRCMDAIILNRRDAEAKDLTPKSPLQKTERGLENAATTPPRQDLERGQGGEVDMQTPPQPLPIPQGGAIDPAWFPDVPIDVIIGNPPFLGGSKLRGELGDAYYETLTKVYAGRVPGFADLVCYWYEKARAYIEQAQSEGRNVRAGLLATNSIRGGANREVLNRIKKSGDIFMAVSDREWALEGAAVRISMVGFDAGIETEKRFSTDGKTFAPVTNITPDLTASVDITIAKQLAENLNLQYEGTKKGANFDISDDIAKEMLTATNLNGYSNTNVIKKWVNGNDIVQRPRGMWVIDFGTSMSLEEASHYEKPFKYIVQHVKPKYGQTRNRWWLHERSRPEMRIALANLPHYIITPRVAKHRIFVWMEKDVLPDSAVIAIARDDDYFFGVLHSKIHEVWSLRMGTWLGKGNDPRYTPTTTFETFPFPFVPGKEDKQNPHVQAIAAAAKQLHEERSAWLTPHLTVKSSLDPTPNPSPYHREGNPTPPLHAMEQHLATADRGQGGEVKMHKDRTLTNLYNALAVFRGKESIRTVPAAGDFAPRLDALHTTLDAAVCAAYGWDVAILQDDEAILRELLALNLARSVPPNSLPTT